MRNQIEKESIDLSLRFCCKIIMVGGDGRELVVYVEQKRWIRLCNIPAEKGQIKRSNFFGDYFKLNVATGPRPFT